MYPMYHHDYYGYRLYRPCYWDRWCYYPRRRHSYYHDYDYRYDYDPPYYRW